MYKEHIRKKLGVVVRACNPSTQSLSSGSSGPISVHRLSESRPGTRGGRTLDLGGSEHLGWQLLF